VIFCSVSVLTRLLICSRPLGVAAEVELRERRAVLIAEEREELVVKAVGALRPQAIDHAQHDTPPRQFVFVVLLRRRIGGCALSGVGIVGMREFLPAAQELGERGVALGAEREHTLHLGGGVTPRTRVRHGEREADDRWRAKEFAGTQGELSVKVGGEGEIGAEHGALRLEIGRAAPSPAACRDQAPGTLPGR